MKASPDHRFLISGTVWGSKQEATVWDISSGKPISRGLPLDVAGVVSSMSFDRSSEYFALGLPESTVRIRRLSDLAEVAQLPSEGPWMTGAAFSPCGRHFVAAGASGELRIFRDWQAGKNDYEVTAFRTDDEFRRIEFFTSGNAFVTAAMDGYSGVWRLSNLSPTTETNH